MTHRHQILADLKKGHQITPLDAWRDYGCYRLGARVHELRQDGWPIETERLPVGDAVVARYSMGREGWPE